VGSSAAIEFWPTTGEEDERAEGIVDPAKALDQRDAREWAAAGVLPHVRIVNVIRIRPEDLTRFVAERSP
jgi:hypothetical protein